MDQKSPCAGCRARGFFVSSRLGFWSIYSSGSDILDERVHSMRATVVLDDELVRKAQELSGMTETTTLLREALKALIHQGASRRLAAVGGTAPD